MANYTSLKSEYLGHVEGGNESKHVLKNLHNIWYNKRYKDRKRCGLMCTIIRSNLWRIIAMIVMTVIIFALEFAVVFITKEIIDLFNKKNTLNLQLYQMGLGFLTFKLISIFLSRQNQIFQVSIYSKFQ